MFSSLTGISSICSAGFVTGGKLSSPTLLAVQFLSVSWISGRLFWELLRSGTGLLLVSFHWIGSLLDPDFWRDVRFTGNICSSTSTLSCDSGVCLVWTILLVLPLWVLTNFVVSSYVSGGCCKTTFVIGGSIVLVVSGLSITDPEWRRCFFSLKVRLQPGHSQLCCFGCLFVGPGSVLRCSEAVCLPH